MREIGVVAVMLVLVACDNTPNSSFEQSAKDREAARAGDRYASLEAALPRQSRYIQRRQPLQRDFAAGEASTYRVTYDGLLKQLDADRAVDRSAVFTDCRTAFDAASAFPSEERGSILAPEGVVAGLTQCREKAQRAKKDGGGGGDTAALLSRFASAGIVLTGVTMVGRGEAAPGLRIWRDGAALVTQDKPGFKLFGKSFGRYE